MLDEIYQEFILDHYKNPRCAGCLHHPDCQAAVYNPLCGDKINLTLNVVDNQLCDVAFLGKGCAISQACASVMAELCKSKSISEVKGLCTMFRDMVAGKLSADEAKALGDAVLFEGIRNFPARTRCALLAWEAMNKCISELDAPDEAKQEV